jgi:hypothetical protein
MTQATSKGPLTQKRLKEVLVYYEELGIFIRRIAPGSRGDLANTIAGWHTKAGYLKIWVDATLHTGHRLAWLYYYGKWPSGVIDHIDGNPANNAIDNLRDTTHLGNSHNKTRPSKRSSTGRLGVYQCRPRKDETPLWRSQICVERKIKHLGLFLSQDEAEIAYLEAKRKYHPESVRNG